MFMPRYKVVLKERFGQNDYFIFLQIGFSKSDLDDYLSKPPSGVDARLWKQAVADNPDPAKFIPVPLIGFKSLQVRLNQPITLLHSNY